MIRPVNAHVLQQLRATRANVAEYQLLEQRRAGVQVAFGLMYVAIALTLLLSAIWIGMWFANRLVAPIRQLMGAAQQISEGNLDVEVDTKPADGDLAVLGSTFNTMTSELKSQRDALVGANTTLDERRRFMEAVLSGVTAGVVGVDPDGTITLVNRSAEDLLDVKEKTLTGKPLAEAVPEFGALMKRAQKQGKRLVTDQISLRRGGSERNFAVRVTSEGTAQQAQGYVVTFDDITELVSAQRSTAWADVARRIAHEIKNPLTPIQLSAERIRRKYGDSITKDRDVFEQCTDTIIRQVSDIGRMVDEFSAFARMPKPVMELHDIREIVREAVFLFQVSRPEITFELDLPEKPAIMLSDRRLLDPGRHQPRQECERGHRYRDGSRARPRRQGSRHRQGAHQGRPAADHRDRQWLRPAEGEPPAAGRALHDHARQGHRPWPRHRAADHRAAWRNACSLPMRRSGTARCRAHRCAWTCRSARWTRCSADETSAGNGAQQQATAPEAAEEEEGVTHGV